MREVSRRFRARLSDPVEWLTEVDWSNDGGRSWSAATFLSGKVTASALSQMRWACDLSLFDAPFGAGGINPYSTRLRVRHGMAGEPLLPMGVFKVTDCQSGRDGSVQVTGRSFEWFVIGARFRRFRSFPSMPAERLVDLLVREVMGSAEFNWLVDGSVVLPRLSEEQDRWGLIDGRTDAASVARSLGARAFCDGAGLWTVAPVPALTDPAVWEAAEGDGGVLLDHSESLTSEGVYNIVVAVGEAEENDAGQVVFQPKAEVADKDRLSPTFVDRPVDDGGFGPIPRFYESQFIRTNAQAERAARGLLAPSLGLRQKVDFSQLHDPTLEPGDVGIVHTVRGPRRVILDEVTYDLAGGPLSTQTRTTATRLDGSAVVELAGEGGE